MFLKNKVKMNLYWFAFCLYLNAKLAFAIEFVEERSTMNSVSHSVGRQCNQLFFYSLNNTCFTPDNLRQNNDVVVFNEIHSNNPTKEMAEFIELRLYPSQTVLFDKLLKGYYIIQIETRDKALPAITMVIDLSDFQFSTEYFTIGGLEVEKASIKCDNPAVAFKSQILTGNYANFITNGDVNPVALVLLYSEIKLNLILNKKTPEIKINRNLEVKLNPLLKDMIVFGRKSYGKRCEVFEKLKPELKNMNYIIKELNVEYEKQLSMNRCTVNTKQFTPESFRLGTPTPNDHNNCDLSSYSFEGNIFKITPIIITVRPSQYDNNCSSDYPPQVYESVETDMVVQDIKRMKVSYENEQCHQQLRDTNINEITDNLETSRLRAKDMGFEPDYIWKSTKHFNETWLIDIEEAFPGKMPINLINSSDNIRSWFNYIPVSSTYNCRLCSSFYDEFHLNKQYRPELANKEGVEISDNPDINRNMINRHYDSASHTAVISDLKNIANKNMEEFFIENQLKKEIEEIILAPTSRVFRSVYAGHLSHISFRSFRYLIELQKINRVELGSYFGNYNGMLEMTSSISRKMEKILLTFLKTQNMPVSIIMDTSTDLRKNHYLSVLFQTLEDERPTVYFYRLIKLTSDETALGIYNELIKWLEKDDLIEYLKNNLVGYNTDGASVFRGEQNGVLALLRKRLAPKKFLANHCMAHRLELALQHGLKDFDWHKNFEKSLNSIYTFYYSHGHKRLSFLRDQAEELNLKFYSLHYIYKIRWVSSDYSVIQNIRKMWFLFYTNLNSIIESEKFDEETKIKAKIILDKISDKFFVLLLHFIEDILSNIHFVSKGLQIKGGSIIGKSLEINRLIDSMETLKLNEGSIIIDYLSQVQCFQGEMIVTCTLAIYEGELTIWQNVTLKFTDKFPILSEIRKQMMEKIVIEFEKYFPDGDLKDYDVFDPYYIPLSREYLVNYGKSSIKSIHNFFNFPCTEEQLLYDWSNLLLAMYDSTSEWCDVQKSKPHIFWSRFLQKKTLWTDCTATLIRTVLAIPAGSADAERSFSYLNNIHKMRFTLSPRSLDENIRIRFNGPKELVRFRSMDYARFWVVDEKRPRVDDFKKRVEKEEPYPGENPENTYYDRSKLF